MRKTILASLAVTTILPALAMADVIPGTHHRYLQPRDTIYLGDSSVYDAIREKDPVRYDKIIEVLRVAQVEPCESLPGVLKTKLDVEARCRGYQVYTSFPAKTRLRFTVEDTDYVAYVVQDKLSGGKLIPAR
ncbi:MAG TPA: hypothetical protein VFE23_00445 [Usitatibacter sp.]|nr:hypothetical protein [Usitatibacter sp.]